MRPRNKQGRTRILPWAKRPQLIAIIDEDESTQESLRKLLESGGFVARCFGSAEEFLESDLYHEVECLIAVMQMPGISGLELQARLKAEQCNIPIIFIISNGGARVPAQSSSWRNRWIINCCSRRSEPHLICERHGCNNRIV